MEEIASPAKQQQMVLKEIGKITKQVEKIKLAGRSKSAQTRIDRRCNSKYFVRNQNINNVLIY
jgi:hypothetical protein